MPGVGKGHREVYAAGMAGAKGRSHKIEASRGSDHVDPLEKAWTFCFRCNRKPLKSSEQCAARPDSHFKNCTLAVVWRLHCRKGESRKTS